MALALIVIVGGVAGALAFVKIDGVDIIKVLQHYAGLCDVAADIFVARIQSSQSARGRSGNHHLAKSPHHRQNRVFAEKKQLAAHPRLHGNRIENSKSKHGNSFNSAIFGN